MASPENPSVIGSLRVNVDLSGITDAKKAIEELAAASASLDEKIGTAVDIKRLTLQPDDALVVRVDQHLTHGMMVAIKDHVTSIFGDRKVLVLGKGMTLDVLQAA